MTDTDQAALREQIAKIWGLETDPDGEPEYLLRRDEPAGTIIDGVDYSDEVSQTIALFQAQADNHPSTSRGYQLGYAAGKAEAVQAVRDGLPSREYVDDDGLPTFSATRSHIIDEVASVLDRMSDE